MNKKLKEKLIKKNQEMRAAFPSLYEHRWVEQAADKGWKDVIDTLDKSVPSLKKPTHERALNIFAAVYYTAFENALNTFLAQCLDDALTEVQLTMRELQKVTAEIKTKED